MQCRVLQSVLARVNCYTPRAAHNRFQCLAGDKQRPGSRGVITRKPLFTKEAHLGKKGFLSPGAVAGSKTTARMQPHSHQESHR